MDCWTLYPSDCEGDAEAPDGHERLIAIGPDVRGATINVIPSDAAEAFLTAWDEWQHDPYEWQPGPELRAAVELLRAESRRAVDR